MFKFSHHPEIRFRDIDVLGHVNNAVYLSYLEQTRILYLSQLGLRGSTPSTILVANEIDYLRPVLLTDVLEVKMACEHIGTKSLVFVYEIFANGTLAAKAKSTHVWFDAATNSTSTVPEHAVQILEGFEGQTLKNQKLTA
jgi:acyl-CoA thioester hydrolase